MNPRLAADAVVVVHLLFVAFVVAGGALVLRDARWSFAHLPAVAWGAYAELTATVCPLTPLENALRRAAGESGYPGGFVEHLLLPVLYPAGLAPAHQWLIGWGVLVVNGLVYALAVRRLLAKRRRMAGERTRP